MSDEGLSALRSVVVADPELAQRLRRLEPARFTHETVRLSAELGCDVADADLRAAVDEGRRRWALRWIR